MVKVTGSGREGMSASQILASQLPPLRRYARALCGSQQAGDAFVRATLETALADEEFRNQLATGRVGLYRGFTAIWSRGQLAMEPAAGPAGLHETAAAERLHSVTPLSRQALLLTSLEEFSMADAAMILGLENSAVAGLVQSAIAEIERETATSVLIIEDEPLIAMQLEDLVRSLGHDIAGTAATRSQAVEAVARSKPGLVLADIQLADGSSGLDAVEDILQLCDVPVIFVTAYPERLLTGDRIEPTYLVTKPFRNEAVRAAVSQALFFKSGRPL